MSDDCPFCDRVARGEYAEAWGGEVDCVVFAPLSPVVPGHLLVVPIPHVEHQYADAPEAVGSTMEIASMVAKREYDSYNLITSCGRPATQTVPHVHAHIIPRHVNDGLALPWTGR